MKVKELRELSKDELEKKLNDFREEYRKIRFAKIKGELKNPLKKRIVKRAIARILTIMKEKQNA
jgi:large subunit ribosomal protein L29